MQIRIGESIRALRQRDGRRQEDLAAALGVTAQAVSRWETNTVYPDISVIPAIANYFHVTIDELFGYNSDRDERIAAIIAEVEKVTGDGSGSNLARCAEMLKSAVGEFPSEPKLFMSLGFVLLQLGWRKHGARMYTKDGSDYAYEDIEYNSQNPYWLEAHTALERALELGLDADNREAVLVCLVASYSRMGMDDKARALAARQNSMVVSRELLMALIGCGKEQDRYLGEALIELMTRLSVVMERSVATKMSLAATDAGIEKLTALIRLFEAIFDDGRCGIAHTHLRDLYLCCAVYKIRLGRRDEAKADCLAACQHDRDYRSIRCTGEYHYTAPLVAEVTFPSGNFPGVPANFWEGWQSVLPDDFVEELKADNRFAGCFG